MQKPSKLAQIPQIRFAGFTEDWERRKLGITKTFFTDGNYGESYPKASDMADSSKGIPFLTGGNLKEGKLDISGASYITKEKHEKLISGHLVEDDIVIAVRGSLGSLGYVNKGNSGWNINSQLAILRTDKKELYGKFLLQFLISDMGQNELLKRQTGSALKQLPIGVIKDVEVPITLVEEQTKIGELFANLDNLITLQQRKVEKLKDIKAAMLSKAFI
jgi:type I restriction enzyme S subunit